MLTDPNGIYSNTDRLRNFSGRFRTELASVILPICKQDDHFAFGLSVF